MKPEKEKALDESFTAALEEDKKLTLKITQRFVNYQVRIGDLGRTITALRKREAIFLEVMHGVHEPCNKTHCKICVAMQEATKAAKS